MVVYNVERYGHSLLMASVYEPLKGRRASVRVLHCKRVDAVVAPVAVSGKLHDRHEFDRSDAQILQLTNSGNDCIERTLWRECSDVKFVKDVLLQGDAGPTIVGPCEV